MIATEEYIAMGSDKLPYSTKWGLRIDELTVECVNCGENVEDVKCCLNEYTDVVEIRTAGVCHKCKLVVSGKITRLYKDDRVTWKNNDGVWVQSFLKYGVLGRIKQFYGFVVKKLKSEK